MVHCRGRLEHALEDLGLAAHVELSRRLVEQHHAGALPHRTQGSGERNTLPLPTRQIGATGVGLGEDGVEIAVGQIGPPASASAARMTSSGAPVGATLLRSGSSKWMKSWNTAATVARQAASSNESSG